MGKNNHKISKNRNQQQVKKKNQEMADLWGKLSKQYEDMDYGGALETAAEIIGKKCYDSKVVFKIAQIFFMQGDYERAASWIDNTLYYDSGHIEARLLLARICLLEDRVDDAMAIYDFLLRAGEDALTLEQQEDIKEATDYIVRTDGIWLRKNYPVVANLVNAAVNSEKKINLQAQQDREETEVTIDNSKLEKIIIEVLNSPVSLREKVSILNAYAGGYFINNEYEKANNILQKAMELDGHDNVTLRNLAVLAKEMGQMEKALTYAGCIKGTDFLLIKQLMQ